MNQHNYNKRDTTPDIISEYEAMSQKGTVGFFEEKVFLELIEHYEKEDSFDKAMDAVDQALSQHIYSSDLLLCKARLLFEAEEEIAALECLDKANVLTPDNISIQIFRSRVLSALGYNEEALKILNEVNSRTEETPPEFYWCMAVIQEKMYDLEEMFNSLKHYLLLNPRDVNALRKAWYCVEFSGIYEESITFHKELLDIDPYSYLAWHNLGQAYFCMKNYKKAAWAFEYSYITNPQFESGYKDFALSCIKLGSYSKALRAFEELLDLEDFTADSETLLRIGECYESKEDYGIAHAFYLKAVIMNPNNHEVYFRTGECYAKCQKWECAIDAYQKAIELESKREEYYASLGETFFQIGEDEKAKKYFQRAADTAPDDYTYWVQYASFLMDINDIDAAIEVLQEATDYTTSAELDYCMAACRLRKGEKKLAINLLVNALQRTYDKHDVFFNLVPNISKEPEILDLIKFYSQN